MAQTKTNHAIMVIGHGTDYNILQETINILDDPDIDFFVHWDRRYKNPELKSNTSKIFFVPNRKVNWGTDGLIFAEIQLMKSVIKSPKEYSYVHLISSVDMPLMSKSYFKNYFTAEAYLGFVKEVERESLLRVKYYYPFRYFKIRNPYVFRLLTFIFRSFNKLFGVNRLRDKDGQFNMERGSQWFSLKSSAIKQILSSRDLGRFMNSYFADEMFVQSILSEYKPNDDTSFEKGDSAMAARYIDWDRGAPYTFQTSDVLELKSKLNKDFAFARKVTDVDILKAVFDVEE